jgi:hypothetical protein
MLPMTIASFQLGRFLHWQLDLATGNTTTLATFEGAGNAKDATGRPDVASYAAFGGYATIRPSGSGGPDNAKGAER